ncbi:CBS domain-containing protein [Methanopyrus sp.]
MARSVTVGEIAQRRVVTGGENETAEELAYKMREHGIGSVVIVDEEERPVGIVTERDLVIKVVSRGLRPDEVVAREIMSSPVITVNEDVDVNEAVEIMVDKGIRRLPIVDEEGRLVGIVTMQDILRVEPHILRTIEEEMERFKEELREAEEVEETVEGVCDLCETYSEELRFVDGMWVCPECYEEILGREIDESELEEE